MTQELMSESTRPEYLSWFHSHYLNTRSKTIMNLRVSSNTQDDDDMMMMMTLPITFHELLIRSELILGCCTNMCSVRMHA